MRFLATWSDARLGFRLMARQPVLSATIVLALATGIGLAVVGFTLRDALLHSSLPFAGGERFVRLNGYEPTGDRAALDLDRYHLVLDKASTLEHVGAVSARRFTVAYPDGEVESVGGALITPRSMRVLPATPLVGRVLIPADGVPGAERVALLRESLWKRRYSSDPALVGRQLEIAGSMRTVVGVMPDTFKFPSSGEIWLPLDDLTLGGSMQKPADGIGIFGIVRPGTDFIEVNAELDGLSRQVAVASGSKQEIRVLVRPYTRDSDDSGAAFSALVLVLVLLVLVVASHVATLISRERGHERQSSPYERRSALQGAGSSDSSSSKY